MHIKINTNGTIDQYPYKIEQLRRNNPSTSFPKLISKSILESFGVYKVIEQDIPPEFDERIHYIEESKTPEFIDGKWTIVKNIVDKTQEEINDYDQSLALDIRKVRDRLLKDTDWTQLPDAPADSLNWESYRQALRDLTQQTGFPSNVEWPVSPDAPE